MAATASAMLDLTNKATNLAREVSLGWYKASQAMNLFPARLIELRKRSDDYTSLVNRYGMENDIEPLVRVVIQLLEDEEVKLRRLQDNCCLRTGKKLLFPDSVITALDGVLEAFDRLPEHINARESLAEQLERSSNSKPRLLPFSHDDKYVLLKKSVLEVRTALESESSARIVVISGGPGQGKSSMARYLACLYQNGMRTIRQAQRIPEPASSSVNQTFENGVIFLKCGAKVNTKSLLVQLWQDMGFQELPLSTTSQELAGDQNDLQEENILKKLSARLQNQKVLIVLDDVWDPTVVEKLMVQGKSVKYLVTTQVPRFRCDAIDIHISKPNKQEANCIIANYVTGYPKEISSDIQMEIDSIIEESDFNPLLLANVATSLRHGEASELSEWKSTRKYLADLQDGDVKRPVSLYDRSYSKRTMGASMEMALNSFSSEEQTLVLLASVFESRPIPEVVFKILFKSVHSSLARFFKSSELLVRSNFIEIQSVLGNAIWGSISRRGWSIHTMRQNFINRIKEKEIDVMFTKLCEQVEHNDIVAMLLVMYGQEPWCDKAARKLGIPGKQFEGNDTTRKNFPLTRIIEPFVWVLNGEPQNETEKQSHQLTTQIIHKYLHSNELDGISISTLLQEPKMFSTTSEALYATQNLHDTLPTFQIGDTSSSPLPALVGNLAHTNNPQLQKEAVVTLAIICKNMPSNAMKIGSFPHAVERLVALLDHAVPPQTQEWAAWALGQLSVDVVENAMRIGSFPHAVERLVALLDHGVPSQTQAHATWALGKLSVNVVENAMRIGSFPHVVERLVALLDHGVPSQTQQAAACALGQLSVNVVENAMRIGSFPHVVERLVALLDHGVPSQTQLAAACALGRLSINVVENAMRIGSFPHAVERLVALLDHGVPLQTQEWAAWALGRLSVDVVENAVRIGSFPHALERLVRLLVMDGEDDKFQCSVIRCLLFICDGVHENQVFLRRVFMENPGCIEILASCASMKAQGSGLGQYFGAQVYHLVNGDNGTEIKYESSKAYEGRGDFKVKKEDFMGALRDYENGLAIDKENLQGALRSKRFFVKAKLGDFQGALANANEFLQIHKDNRSFGLQERGILKRLMGDLLGALADLDESLHLETDDYEVLKHRGLVKFLLNDEDGARADAEWALRVKPARVYAYDYGRAVCFGTSSVEYLGYQFK